MVSLTPITPDLGVEIRGLVLDSTLVENVALLRRASLEHHLLVIRAKILAPAEQIALARIFGVPERWPHEPSQLADHPEIYRVANTPGAGHQDIGRYWHADGTFIKDHPTAISLWHVVEHPSQGGDTLFANMHLAYETLPADLKAKVDRLQMVGVSGAVHPVVQIHPVTGRRALYTSIGMTKSFVGLAASETQALLKDLNDHLDRPGGHYRHQWRAGDVIVGDNFSVAHQATPLDPRYPRILHRVTIRGDASIHRLAHAAKSAAESCAAQS
jgi:taurine dioxygenase